jgi:ribosomal protein L4
MQLEMGSTPAPGVATRRPRRVDSARAEPLNGESFPAGQKVTGEGASHSARGGRAPLFPHGYG